MPSNSEIWLSFVQFSNIDHNPLFMPQAPKQISHFCTFDFFLNTINTPNNAKTITPRK
jgi:hypothetical protein